MGKKRLNKKRFAIFLLVIMFLMGGIGFGWSYLHTFGAGQVLPAWSREDEMAGNFRVLLLGMDARPGEMTARTDSMILVSVDNDQHRIALLSIPRDTLVNIPGHGESRINAANVYGGPELACRMVSELVGMNVNNYILTNFNGFKEIVDTLGGVTIDVERDMYYYDPYDSELTKRIELKKGVQRLDGEKALMYVRFRHDSLGDISRTQRQQKFLLALAEEMKKPANLVKLPVIVPQLARYVQTNLSLGEMIAFARAAQKMSDYQVVSQTLPGKFLTLDGASYWQVDPFLARQVAYSLIHDGKVYQVVQGETVINRYAQLADKQQSDSSEGGVLPPGSTGAINKGGSNSGKAGDREESSKEESLKEEGSKNITGKVGGSTTYGSNGSKGGTKGSSTGAAGGSTASKNQQPVGSSGGKSNNISDNVLDSKGSSTSGGSGISDSSGYTGGNNPGGEIIIVPIAPSGSELQGSKQS